MGIRWAGNREAQRQADAAYAAARDKPKPRKNKKRRRKGSPPRPRPGIDYGSYLLSEWWRWVRKKKLDSTRRKCERCGKKGTIVHHRHYRSLGNETNADLETVCKPCHEAEHECLVTANGHLAAIQRQEV